MQGSNVWTLSSRRFQPFLAFYASSPSSTNSHSTVEMCRSLTFIIEYSCGHRYPKDTQKVDCKSTNCKISSLHSTAPHACLTTCKQGREPPVDIVNETSTVPCASCAPPMPRRRG
ncbi:hypothetical protein EXIGLDRAFT_723165 [Exidia glandulosa HHB12029]|uniref:Uncharacterized protein n=1 Tax=Exidia glandulosa HHB12029 TaxID=1314781 RepID=A0A165MZZ8_EXIGL|nr:hypothetical protein EXIGLDRAFT_723165 [Exidia glandulosa HHB12029]